VGIERDLGVHRPGPGLLDLAIHDMGLTVFGALQQDRVKCGLTSIVASSGLIHSGESRRSHLTLGLPGERFPRRRVPNE
jgi:hypothetical protein